MVVAEGSLGLCFRWRANAARMLMMCTWKYIDLGKKKEKKLKLNFPNFNSRKMLDNSVTESLQINEHSYFNQIRTLQNVLKCRRKVEFPKNDSAKAHKTQKCFTYLDGDRMQTKQTAVKRCTSLSSSSSGKNLS